MTAYRIEKLRYDLGREMYHADVILLVDGQEMLFPCMCSGRSDADESELKERLLTEALQKKKVAQYFNTSGSTSGFPLEPSRIRDLMGRDTARSAHATFH